MAAVQNIMVMSDDFQIL